MSSRLHYRAGLLRGLLSRERAHVGPYYVHVDVTHRCNLRCVCCRWHSPLIESRRGAGVDGDFPADLFDRLCEELQALGTRMVFFVGTGEPLLHPEIFRLIRSATGRGLELVVYTNGLGLTDSTIDRLIDLRVDVLRVSLWAPDAAGFEEQVGAGSSPLFGRIVDGMRRLTEHKRRRDGGSPLLELCQTITSQSFSRLEALLPLAEEVGCERLCFSPLVDFDEDPLRRFLPSPGERRRITRTLSRMKRRLAELSIDHNIDTMLLHYRTDGRLALETPCYPAWFFSYFRSDGKVFLCQRNGRATRPVGDLTRASFTEIWNGDAYRSARRVASSRGGPAASGEYFCQFCSHSMNTHKVHRVFRWVRPGMFVLPSPGR